MRCWRPQVDVAQEGVGGGQVPARLDGEEPEGLDGREGLEGGGGLEEGLLPAVNELEGLGDELDLAYPPLAELHVQGAAAARGELAVDAVLDPADLVEGADARDATRASFLK